MKTKIEAAIRAAESVADDIAKIKENIAFDDPRFEHIDDAHLGAKWTVKRLKDLANTLP